MNLIKSLAIPLLCLLALSVSWQWNALPQFYQTLPNAALDLGCNFGITQAAADDQAWAGLSVRFCAVKKKTS